MDKQTLSKVIQIVTAAAVLLAVIMFIALFINLITLFNLKSRRERLNRELQRLDAQSRSLDELIEYKSADAYTERYAREYLNMRNKDETVFNFTGVTGGGSPTESNGGGGKNCKKSSASAGFFLLGLGGAVFLVRRR